MKWSNKLKGWIHDLKTLIDGEEEAPPVGPQRGKAEWGSYRIPDHLVTRHFMACGTTGSGKSTLLRMLFRSVLPDVSNKNFDTRALIYDPKSEAYPDLASLGLTDETIILNPFDSRCTAWDIGRDISDVAQARELAAVMVPPVEGPNKYFYDGSRLLLEMAAIALIKLCRRDWTFRDLLLACANTADLKHLVERAGIATAATIEDFLTADKEAKAVRMTLTVENSNYHTIAAAWEEARKKKKLFSIHDWVAGGLDSEGKARPQILLLGASKQARTALATVNRLLLQRVQQLLLDYKVKGESTGRRSWVFLDEFPTLGTVPYLEELLTEGRSRGVCTILGFQHIAHVEKWYRGLANALIGQCHHQAYFKALDASMAQWCAAQFGRLIKYDEDDDTEGPPRIKVNDPAATENDFMFMETATEKAGFRCIIRSEREVIRGPKKIKVGRREDLAAVDLKTTDPKKAGFVEWTEPLELKAWDGPERARLKLPEVQVPAPPLNLPQAFPDLVTGSDLFGPP